MSEQTDDDKLKKLENCLESYRAFVKWEVHFVQFL